MHISTLPQRKLPQNQGFSLVELMIVVAILGISAAIAIPTYQGYITAGKKKAAEAVLEQFPVLLETYRAEFGKMCPSCHLDGTYTFNYSEDNNGSEDSAGNKITETYSDFRAKNTSSTEAVLYDYQLIITVSNCAISCEESASFTATPVISRGAPPGPIPPLTYR